MQIQGSNDLARWTAVHSRDLPDPSSAPLPAAIEIFQPGDGVIAIPFAHVRVRWVIFPALALPGCPSAVAMGAFFNLTAQLDTGVEAE